MIFHAYEWHEAVAHTDVLAGVNQRLHRHSIDVLLPGPTSLDQIEVEINEPGTKVTVSYIPPVTYLSADRTAVRTADIQGVPTANLGVAMGPMRATNRVQGHENALLNVRAQQSKVVDVIDTLFPCDSFFCTRDDYGRDGRCQGISIGVYRHHDPGMQVANQHVWILHIELTDRKRAKATPSKPSAHRVYSGIV